MKRYLETLFRLKELFLIPLLVTPIVAVVVVLSLGKSYEVPALLWAEPSVFLDTPFGAAQEVQEVNEREGQAIQERLSTETFRRDVMERSGLTSAIRGGEWPVDSGLAHQLDSIGLSRVPVVSGVLQSLGMLPPANTREAMERGLAMVKDSIDVTPEGNNLIRITYKGESPILGQRLVEEVINLYREKTLQNRTEAARAGMEFYTRQARLQETHMQEASNELQRFLQANPAPLPGQSRPPTEQAKLERLESSYLLEQTLYEGALRKLEEVRVESEATISDQDLSFQVIDAPQAPETSGFGSGAIALVVVLGLALGTVVGSSPIILATWLDGTIRTREDIEQIAGAPVIAQAPVMPLDQRRPDLLRRALARGHGPQT